MKMIMKRHVLGALAVGVTAMCATAPAQAEQRNPTAIVVGHIERDDCCQPIWRPARERFDCDYERGFAIGRDRGFDAGFRDGSYGRCYENRPTASFAHVSCEFRDGYLAGFTKAYAAGFERGSDARRCRDAKPGWRR